jgi:methionine-rich copper-binding protein CopC
VPVSVDANAPSVNPVFNTATNLLHLNAQDTASGIASIEISRDGGQSWTAHSGPVGFTRDGTYVIQYRVRDAAGNLATGQTTVKVVTVPNITVPADQTAFEAASHSFNLGSFADQAADNLWNVDIDWGDSSAHSVFTLAAPGSLGSLPHTYADNGTYTVIIKVTDQAGNTGSRSFRIMVANVAPTAAFTATSGPLNEGDFATLTFSNPSDPSPIDTQAGFRYAFDCGDGSGFGAPGTASSVSCRALDNPNQVVRGRMLDKDGGMSEYSAVTIINNMAPMLGAIAGPASPVVRDTPATITASFTDVGVRDTHAVTVDWDDGTVSAGTVTETNGSGSASASHSYARPGRYTVMMTVTDKDGASVVGTYTIQVRGGSPAR